MTVPWKRGEMDTKDVIKELKEAKNIYDVLVILYGYIDDEHSPAYLQEYDRISQDRNWKDINRLLDELGPLNTLRDKYRLYLSPESSMLKESEAMRKSKYRLISYRDGSGIFARIDSYYITPVSRREPKVVMRGYKKEIFPKREKGIRIACIPLCIKRWFCVKPVNYASGDNYFKVINENPEKVDINKGYLALLECMIEENVEIAVFPELSMNERTEREIKDYLVRRTLELNEFPLKLVFLGSLWKEGKNECVLLSGNGSVLCRNRKQNPFELELDGKKYKEALCQRPKCYETIDISRLGRVLYLVCKDAFDEMAQAAFRNEYEINFEVISSYSASVSLFGDQMRDLSEKHLGIGMIANSCCPRAEKGERDIGFIEIPYMRKKKPYKLEGMQDRYEMDDGCMGQCSFAKCMHIFEFKPDCLQEDCERAGITVDYTKKILK